jgi:hypothetical protein
VCVSASLDNAQKRNASRPRKLPPEIVKGDYDKSVKNIVQMKKIFGQDLLIITNDDDLSSLERKTSSIFGKLLSWSTSFPGNKPATLWKQRQLLTKKINK